MVAAGGGGSTDALDDFRILGPVSGTAISIQVQLHLQGGVSGAFDPGMGATIRGYLRVDPAGEVAVSWTSPPGLDPMGTDTVMTLEIVEPADTSFRVEYRVSAGTLPLGSGFMNGTLAFSGLPAGAAIVSCWGYQAGQPV